jgi:hypothetical protein
MPAAMRTSWFETLVWGRKAEFRDDRGRPARLLGATPFRPGNTQEEGEARREARRIIRRKVSAADVGCPTLLAAYVALLAFTRMLRGAHWPNMGALLWAGIILGVGLLVAWSAARVNNSPTIARELVGKSLCPQCGYSFAGVGPEPDGCVVCPECEAAWRVA